MNLEEGEKIKEELIKCLNDSLNPIELAIDCGSCGNNLEFNILVVSDKFEGVKSVGRHRLVHQAIGDHMKLIHALTIKAYLPREYFP